MTHNNSTLDPRTLPLPNSTFDPRTSTLPDSSFHPSSEDGYLQLSPMGVFPHSRGWQKVDRSALETLVKNFNSFFARLGRRFAGVPFYVGHPDVRGLENLYSDRKAYGWIMELQAREDGLYGRPKWSAAGRDLIANGHFKFLSPYWEVKNIGSDEGKPVYQPTVLVSVGLTNEPNLPVLPLANCGGAGEEDSVLGIALPLPSEKQQPSDPTSPSGRRGDETHLSSSTSEPSDASPNRARGNQSETVEPAPVRPGLPGAPLVENEDKRIDSESPNSAPSASSADSVSLLNQISTLEARLANCQEQLARLHERFLNTVLDDAVAQARIRPGERRLWRAGLEEDFERVSLELANAVPTLKVTTRTANLPRDRRLPEPSEQKQRRILAFVNEKMNSERLTYLHAWLETRAEHPELF